MHNGRRLPIFAALLSFTAGFALPVQAADWYVAALSNPPKSAAPSGSENDPFATVNAALKSGKVKGGDRIVLKDGSHGSLSLSNLSFDSQVTITSQSEKKAHLDDVEIDKSRNIRLLNLSVWPTNPSTAPSWLVHAESDSPDIVVEGLVVRSAKGSEETFANWDSAMWEARKFSGIKLRGPRGIVVGNDLMGTSAGIFLVGDGSKAINNVTSFYNGDGMRGLGDNNVFRGNRVFNCIKTDDNHADGFQSYAGPSGKVVGLVLDSNVIIEWIHPKKDHPLRCRLQGIGLFDGFYDNLTIINNLVTTTQYHGISVYGARNAVISNNTVANTDHLTGPHPYIGVRDHKNGSVTTGVLVSNNLAMSFTGDIEDANAVKFRNNSVIGTPAAVFENPVALDYRPKAASGFIDTGDAASATPVDILGKSRPSGKGPDRGAYEVAAGGGAVSPVPPTDPSGPTEPVVKPPVTKPPVTKPPVTKPPVTKPPVVKPPVAKPPRVKESFVKTRTRRTLARRVSGSLSQMFSRMAGQWTGSRP